MGDAYEIRLQGALSERWLDHFEPLQIQALPEGDTLLHGEVADQAQLYALLQRARDLNSTLLSVTRRPSLKANPFLAIERPEVGGDSGQVATLIIRNETPADYSAIAALHHEAFLAETPVGSTVIPPLMVDLLRHNEAHDPELSIVAELDGQIVGHALFSPFRFVVMGESLPGVMCAPVGVHPDHQGKRIGAAIMAEGHKRAAARGYALSLLVGHSDYYPRFGYLTAVYALAGSRLTVEAPASPNGEWSERHLQAKDLGWLNAGWNRLHASDGLALNPGARLSAWMGQGPSVQTRVLTKAGEPVAYVRYTASNEELRVRELVLAKDDLDGPLAYLCHTLNATKLHLPIPAATLQLDWATAIEDVQTAHPPFMVKPLTEDGPINRYCEQVLSGDLKPSIITFPAPFDIEG